MKKHILAIPTIAALTAVSASAATLSFVDRVQVSTNNANYDLATTPGHASYNDRGIGGSEPGAPTFRNTLGDGTLLDWNLVGNEGTGSALTTYSSGGGGRIPTPVAPSANVHGNGEDWANVWTTSTPGAGIDFAGGDLRDFNIPGSDPQETILV